MKKKSIPKFESKVSMDVICYKLAEIHKDVQKNSKDIEGLNIKCQWEKVVLKQFLQQGL